MIEGRLALHLLIFSECILFGIILFYLIKIDKSLRS